MSAEFDDYARNYRDLLKDPVRDRFAQDAAFFHRRKWDLLKHILSTRFGDIGTLRWLDVGCGQGELLRLGAGSVGEAVGCDPSAEMLAKCRGITVVPQPNMAELPFHSSAFDVVTAACVYHHLNAATQNQLTAEVFRLMRHDGIFVIFEHNPWNPITRLIVNRTPVDANAVLLTSVEARAVMRRAGFDARQPNYYLFFPEAIYRQIGRLERLLGWLPVGGQYAIVGGRP